MDILTSPATTAGFYVLSKTDLSNFWTIATTFLLLTVIAALLIPLALATCRPRQVISHSQKQTTVLGKPLLFPVTLTHTRRKPIQNQFRHRVLLVGTPVGFRGRVGNLLTIDDKSLLGDWIAPWKSWFGIDASRYLHRGDNHLGLQEKLHSFLRSQNLDPAEWPYAYLLSVPQWLWWSRNVVAWWYLYSPTRELDAVIMEINNSFDEKRNVLFRVPGTFHDTAGRHPSSTIVPVGEDLDVAGLVRSLPSNPVAHHYKGLFEKHIYASPFEKVDGNIATRYLDPLHEDSWSPSVSLSNTTTIGTDGDVKLTARLSCCERPVDPTQASAFTLASLLVRWTLPVTLTTPRILYQALRIEFLGLMRMFDKPAIQRGSVPRRATSSERTLEPFFREYLARCVHNSPEPIQIRYLPSQALSDDWYYLRSPSCANTEESHIKHTEVEPLEPGFFTRVTEYDSMIKGLDEEMQPIGNAADPEARLLWVSDTALLRMVLEQAPVQTTSKTADTGFLWRVLFWLRGSPVPTAMDRFVRSALPPSLRVLYVSSLIQHVLARRFAWGSDGLLVFYKWVGVFAIRWLILHVIAKDGNLSAGGVGLYLFILHFLGHVLGKLVVTG